MKIAFISVRPPYPPNAGGRIRTFELLKRISRVHDVTLVTAIEGTGDEEALACLQSCIPHLMVRVARVAPRSSPLRRLVRAAWSPVDSLPYTWAGYRDSAFVANLRLTLRGGTFDLVHCDHVQVAHALFGLEASPCVLNAHNVESALIRRVAEHESRWWWRQVIQWQARKVLRAEQRALRSFDCCIAVSERDRDLIEQMVPGLRVSVVPNGVDAGYFTPSEEGLDPYRIVFTGAMDWLPNIDGVTFFVQNVLPRIQAKIPGAELWVVGRNPSQAIIRQLGNATVHFTGTVIDVRPHLAQASLVVVPLRIGGGTRLKILEAWAMGKAVLSTTLGAEGLPVKNGENIALADTPELLAELAVALLYDPAECARLGHAGCQVAQEQFDWDRVARLLLRAYDETAEATQLEDVRPAPLVSWRQITSSASFLGPRNDQHQ